MFLSPVQTPCIAHVRRPALSCPGRCRGSGPPAQVCAIAEPLPSSSITWMSRRAPWFPLRFGMAAARVPSFPFPFPHDSLYNEVRRCGPLRPWVPSIHPLSLMCHQRQGIWRRATADPLLPVRSITTCLPCDLDRASQPPPPPWAIGPLRSCIRPPEPITAVRHHRAGSYCRLIIAVPEWWAPISLTMPHELVVIA
jgi:hypothetical protein